MWAYQGTLQALDPFIKNDKAFKLDEYQQGPVNAYRAGGKLWGMPQSPNPVMIYYNRTQLDRTGQQPPTNEWNTDQLPGHGQARHHRRRQRPGGLGLRLQPALVACCWAGWPRSAGP